MCGKVPDPLKEWLVMDHPSQRGHGAALGRLCGTQLPRDVGTVGLGRGKGVEWSGGSNPDTTPISLTSAEWCKRQTEATGTEVDV